MIRIRIGIVAAVMALVFAWPGRAHAQVVYSFGGEHVTKVVELPHNANTNIPSGPNAGRHIDVGVFYKQFSLFFIPLWNWDTRFVGYIGADSYLEVPEEELRAFVAANGGQMPSVASPPFWDAWGGKLVLGGILLIFVLFKIRSRRAG
jgi:hypothetical protein